MILALAVYIACVVETLNSFLKLSRRMAKSRKTKSQRAEEKRQKRIRMVIGAFIIILMVSSVVGIAVIYYAPPSTAPVGTSVRFDYQIQDNIIYADIDDQVIPFYTFPDASVPIEPLAVEWLQDSSAIILAFDPADEENVQFAELIAFDLSSYLDKQTATVVLSESDQYPLPLASCDNSTQTVPIVQIINGTTGFSVTGNCLTLSGNEFSLIAARDQLLYDYFGVR